MLDQNNTLAPRAQDQPTLVIDLRNHDDDGYFDLRNVYDAIPQHKRANLGWANSVTSSVKKAVAEGHYSTKPGVRARVHVDSFDAALRAMVYDKCLDLLDRVAIIRKDIDKAEVIDTITIVLKPGEGAGMFSIRSLYHQLPEEFRARRGQSGWHNTKALLRSLDSNLHNAYEADAKDAKAVLQAMVKPDMVSSCSNKICLDMSAITVPVGDAPQLADAENDNVAGPSKSGGCVEDFTSDPMDVCPEGGKGAKEDESEAHEERSVDSACVLTATPSDTATASDNDVAGTVVPPSGESGTKQKLSYTEVLEFINRVPDGKPNAGYGSVIDVIRLVTRKDTNQSNEVWRRLGDKADGFGFGNLPRYKFKGRGPVDTPVAPLQTLVQIIQALPGNNANVFRVQCASENDVAGTVVPPSGESGAKQKLSYTEVLEFINRVPDGKPNAGYGGVIDVIRLVTGKNSNHSNEVWRNMQVNVLGVGFGNLPRYKFKGRGQVDTPVAPLKTLLQIIQALPGNNATVFRVQCAELLCRVFAGDPNLHVEIDHNSRNVSARDRRDLLCEVPGAAPVSVDDVPGNDAIVSDVPNVAPPPGAQTQTQTQGCISRKSPRDRRAHLRAVPDLDDAWIPMKIQKCAGGYVGVIGLEMVDDEWFVVVKIGEACLIIKRWKEHGASCPHWRPLWAAAVNSQFLTHEDIQTELKKMMARQMAVRDDILLTNVATLNEEYWVPVATYREVIDKVTSDTEKSLGPEIISSGSQLTRKVLISDGAPAPATPAPEPIPHDVTRCFDAARAGVKSHAVCPNDIEVQRMEHEQTIRDKDITLSKLRLKICALENGMSIPDLAAAMEM